MHKYNIRNTWLSGSTCEKELGIGVANESVVWSGYQKGIVLQAELIKIYFYNHWEE